MTFLQIEQLQKNCDDMVNNRIKETIAHLSTFLAGGQQTWNMHVVIFDCVCAFLYFFVSDFVENIKCNELRF